MLYTNVMSNRTIYASYYNRKVKIHKVEFVDYDGRAIYNPQYVIDGGKSLQQGNLQRAGYTFRGWDKEFYQVTEPLKIRAVYGTGNHNTKTVYFYGIV